MADTIEYPTKPLIYPEINGSQNQFTNILLIDSDVPNYQIFVDSVNTNTFPIVYSVFSLKQNYWLYYKVILPVFLE